VFWKTEESGLSGLSAELDCLLRIQTFIVRSLMGLGSDRNWR